MCVFNDCNTLALGLVLDFALGLVDIQDKDVVVWYDYGWAAALPSRAGARNLVVNNRSLGAQRNKVQLFSDINKMLMYVQLRDKLRTRSEAKVYQKSPSYKSKLKTLGAISGSLSWTRFQNSKDKKSKNRYSSISLDVLKDSWCHVQRSLAHNRDAECKSIEDPIRAMLQYIFVSFVDGPLENGTAVSSEVRLLESRYIR